ncbi:peptidoglycan D,D-transpeptidase FtsI [Aurantivibrio infirmus]
MKKIAKDKEKKRQSRQATSRAVRTPVFQPAIVRWRYFFICSFFVIVAVVLVGRLVKVQVLPSQDRGFEFLQQYGRSQFLRNEPISATRGIITDRNGELLAVSTPVVSVCGNPKVLLESKERWAELARSLNISAKQLADKINRYANKEFMYFERSMPPESADKILALDIPGVFPQQEYQRFYPAGEVVAHVVGVTNIDDVGQEGIELAYNDWLRGSAGAKQVVKDLKGRVIEDVRLLNAAIPGKDLSLSIDLRLQFLAYRELKAAFQQHNAVSGSVVILDVKTGEVLAMVNQPSYNPNNRSKVNASAMKNRAITDLFEPGSTMKPLTVLAALESGRYTPGTKIDTSPGWIHVPGKTFTDYSNYGLIDITKIITKSSNVGITKIAMDLSPETIRGMFFRLGLGQDTGTGFPGESVGVLPNHERKWRAVERANMAFGYGLSVNATQLAQAYNVIANGGIKKPVSLLKLSDQQTQDFEDRVVGEKITNQVLAMMRTVLEPGGTATQAKMEAYSGAGKTGTARKANVGGYSEDAKFSVFAGIAPVENPRIVVAVMINEPRNGLYGGGEVAAPIFSGIAEGSLRILQVPPDKVSKQMTTKLPTKREPLS